MAVNARTEEFQHIELFDKYALFTNARIDRSTVPKGWYCYDFRGTDDDPGELRYIGEHVVVNHAHYFAIREGVVIPKKDADTLPTEKQKAYIQRLTKNLPLCRELLEYEDYKEHPTRMTAAEFIAQAYEQFVAPMDKRENYIDYVANRPGAQQVGGHGLWDANGPVRSLHEV